jgi:hypothetical protein
MAADKEKAVTVKGWVSDTMCAAKGDKKCANKDHLKQGAKLALVTDGDNKIWTVENPDKLADQQGHYVQVKIHEPGSRLPIVEQQNENILVTFPFFSVSCYWWCPGSQQVTAATTKFRALANQEFSTGDASPNYSRPGRHLHRLREWGQ